LGSDKLKDVSDKMLVSLVLIFCLASTDTCMEHRPMGEELSSPMACLVEGQQLAQEWLADHPGWTLTRVRCEDPARHHDKSQ
jgi:hypothetical protein